MDIKILSEKPEINKDVKLIIDPLAPLSMVADIPGTYYKAQEVPDKYKLCGLFENILGWHFSKNDRSKILKKVKENYKKKFKKKNYRLKQANSGYTPLLYDFFEMGMVFKNEPINYNDLWKRCFSRTDENKVHPNGTPNLDYRTLRRKYIALRTEKLETFYKININSFPMYYTTPTLREYVDYQYYNIQIALKIDDGLYRMLQEALHECSTAYLGNSESWVEIKIEEL